MTLSFDEMEKRDRAFALEPDGRDDMVTSACPCGMPVVDTGATRDMVGGRNRVTLRYYHSREQFCEFLRVF